MNRTIFDAALGNPRVLAGVPAEDRRHVLAHDGDVVIGTAAFEPLFGRQGEAAIAVAEARAFSIVSYLMDGLLELAGASGITVLRFSFSGPQQRALAHRLTGGRTSCTLCSDRLEIRTELSRDPAAESFSGIARRA